MKPERWQRIDEIFGVALQHNPDERKAFLDEACRGDEELRQEVESLLAAEGAAVKFIEDPAMDILGKDLADEQRGVFIGRTLGPYKILSLLGAGGMGEVYRAEDRHLKRHVAVKVLASHFANDRALMARFEREAHLLASLNHPNIAAIYGLEEANGVRALVMELVEGPTLAERIAAGPIPLDEALPIALQMAEALEYSHEKGVIHRDLKPTNVKLTPEGTVKVLDFGLAKALADGSTTGDLEPTLTVAATETIVASVAITWYLKRDPSPPAPLRLEVALSADQPLPLTGGNAVALSPDGRRLAYFTGKDSTDPNRHLYLRSFRARGTGPQRTLCQQSLLFSGWKLGGIRD